MYFVEIVKTVLKSLFFAISPDFNDFTRFQPDFNHFRFFQTIQHVKHVLTRKIQNVILTTLTRPSSSNLIASSNINVLTTVSNPITHKTSNYNYSLIPRNKTINNSLPNSNSLSAHL